MFWGNLKESDLIGSETAVHMDGLMFFEIYQT